MGFVTEAGRVLRPGGAACVLPLYVSEIFHNVTDPEIERPGLYFDEGAAVAEVRGWRNRFGRFYDAARLSQRVLERIGPLEATIYFIENEKDVAPACYLKFALILRKPSDHPDNIFEGDSKNGTEATNGAVLGEVMPDLVGPPPAGGVTGSALDPATFVDSPSGLLEVAGDVEDEVQRPRRGHAVQHVHVPARCRAPRKRHDGAVRCRAQLPAGSSASRSRATSLPPARGPASPGIVGLTTVAFTRNRLGRARDPAHSLHEKRAYGVARDRRRAVEIGTRVVRRRPRVGHPARRDRVVLVRPRLCPGFARCHGDGREEKDRRESRTGVLPVHGNSFSFLSGGHRSIPTGNTR